MDTKKFIPCWTDLPKELVERIGKLLDTHIDVLYFRAVCTTWRSSLPPLENSPPLPLQIPFPLDRRSGYHLIESTVYIFKPLDGAPSCKGWLIRVLKPADGKLRVLNPLTGRHIKVSPDHMPKVLNLLDFRVSQVCKSYHVEYFNPSRPSFYGYDVGYVRKILLLSDQTSCSFSLMAIVRNNLLCYLKSGDENWTKLNKNAGSYIHDIIVYKGNFYAVDQNGETIKFESSFDETTVAFGLSDGGRKKRLVESGGQLFLVDSSPDVGKNSNLEIKVYRLDEEQSKWIEVQTLGDRIFFAVNDSCFSVSSGDFGECRGNCIYYVSGGVYYDSEDSDDDMMCCCCGYSDIDSPVAGDDHEISYRISNDDHEINDSGSESSGDDVISTNSSSDDQDINDAGGKSGGINDVISTGNSDDGHKINDSGSKLGGLREEQLADRYEEVFDHDTGVFTVKDGKCGSLLSFLDYAEILWPPPSWLNKENQAPSHAHEIAGS